MQKYNFGNLCWILAAAIIAPFFMGVSDVEARLNFSFFEDVVEDQGGRLIRSSTRSVSLSLDQSVSEKVSLEEGLRYTDFWEEAASKSDSVSASLVSTITNDLFLLGLEGEATEGSSEGRSTPDSQTIELRWESLWKEKMLPVLSFSVVQRNSQDNLADDNDTERTDYFASVGWGFKFLEGKYSYDVDTTEIVGGAGRAERENQLANIRLSGTGWDNRLMASLSHTYTFNMTEQVAVSDALNIASVNVLISEVRMGLDDPTDTIELVGDSFQMHDGDLVTGVSPFLPSNTVDHTFLLIVNGQQVDVIYLYAVDTWGGGVPPNLNNWQLYSNDILGNAWNVEVLDPALITYDSVQQRLEIPVQAVQQENLKLVVDRGLTALPDIEFTELEAFQLIAAPLGTSVVSEFTSATNSTQLALNWKINRNFTTNFSSSFRTEETTITSGTDSDSKSNNNSISLLFDPVDRGFSSTLNYSLSNEEKSEDDYLDRQSRSFGISVNKVFLPTLEMSLAQSRSESFTDGEQVGLADTYTLYCNAQLYPDLNSKFDATYNISETFDTDSVSKILDTDFSITSRLKPLLSVTLSENYRRTFNKETPDDQELTSSLSGSWRVSDTLSLNGVYSYANDDSDNSNKQTLSVRSTLAIGSSLQLSVDYSAVEDTFLSQLIETQLLWDLGAYARVRTGADYSYTEDISDEDNYLKFFAELTVNFGLPTK